MPHALTPRARFQESEKLRADWNNLVHSSLFIEAVTQALLHYQLTVIADIGDPAHSGVGFQRLVGASEFLHALMKLGERTVSKETTKPTTLNHSV